MISRRRLLVLLGLSGIMARRVTCKGRPDTKDSTTVELPPHCEALSLIWSTQGDLIKTLEIQHAKAEQSKQKEYIGPEGRWWFDTDGRSWEVTRPFGPGFFDSTHMFLVKYLIGGKSVASWSVDTRKKQVSASR